MGSVHGLEHLFYVLHNRLVSFPFENGIYAYIL